MIGVQSRMYYISINKLNFVNMKYLYVFFIAIIIYVCHSGEKKRTDKIGESVFSV
jgi:hypothetical protein